jgi:hypothetical protein
MVFHICFSVMLSLFPAALAQDMAVCTTVLSALALPFGEPNVHSKSNIPAPLRDADRGESVALKSVSWQNSIGLSSKEEWWSCW